MVDITKAMCWKVVAKAHDSSGIGLVIYQKPTSSSCYEKRKENNPPLCENEDGKNSSWYFLSSGDLISIMLMFLSLYTFFFSQIQANLPTFILFNDIFPKIP